MDSLKQNGRRKIFPVVFYLNLLGSIIILMFALTPIAYIVEIGNISWGYCLEWITSLFAVIFYFVSKEEVYKFWWIIVSCVLTLILLINFQIIDFIFRTLYG